MSSFLTDLKSVLDNKYATIASEGISGETSTYTDTGSYNLNALLSGSIYGGFPGNKIMILGGDPATGKSFFVLSMMQDFLAQNPEGQVVFMESEGAISKQHFSDRKMDSSRVLIVPVTTIQEFRTTASRVLESYEKLKNRPPMMMVLDSLGMLSTSAEVTNASEGKDTRDMTRAQLIRGAFRVLSLKMSTLNVPMIVTNHVGEKIGSYVGGKVFGGGTGGNYAASTMLMLSKSKDKDGTDIVGAIIRANLFKSRTTREGLTCEVKLSYTSGLDRYWGLDTLAVESGVWQSVGGRIILQDGTKVFAKRIYADPTKYFTKDVLDSIDAYCHKKYMFGSSVDAGLIDDTEDLDFVPDEIA